MNKFVLSVVSILMASSIFAEPPEAPVKLFAGSINGYVCFHLQVSADKTLTPVFQCKLPEADDSEWTTVDLAKMTDSFFTSQFIGYNKPVWYAGAMQFRVCYENTGKEASVWTDLGTVTNSVCHLHYSKVSEREFGDIRNSNITDGNTVYPLENTSRPGQSGYAQHDPPVWAGIRFEHPVTTSKIRYVPRQDATGTGRLAKCYLECADDETFETNCRNLGSFPAQADIELGKVLEFNLAQPVTAQYFRICHNGTDFLCIAELEITASEFPEDIPVTVDIPDVSNCYARISWQVPLADQCLSGCVERAVSPLGPFARITDWRDALEGDSFTDTSMAVGVRYFYRVRAVCAGIPLAGQELCSTVVEGCRSKRLDRDWSDLTHLREGVTTAKCFSYVKDETGYYLNDSPSEIKYAFDGDLATWPETSLYNVSNGACRVKNVLVGIDMGTPYHVTGVIACPRPAPQIQRLKQMALFGANAEHMVDADQLSGTYATMDPQYDTYNFMPAADEYADRTYRYAYLLAPSSYEAETMGNVAEVGFFGYSWQDTVDSGVLVPPSSVTAAGTAQNVTVSWTEGATVVSYEVERRVADGEWMTVAELPPEVLAFTDYAAPEGVALEYRVTVHGANDEYAYSYVTASIVPGPGTAQVPPVEIVRSENVSNLAAVVSWSGCGGTYLQDGTLQRSVSPYGPFTDLKELDHPVASFTMTDLTAVPGVTYYYRVRFICDDPLLSGEVEVASEPVSFVRARRLERDWDDLTKLRDGVALMHPFLYLGSTSWGSDSPVDKSFDGDVGTWAEGKCGVPKEWRPSDPRAFNGAVGVDLGSDCHLVGVLAYPRPDTSASRLNITALYGGTSESDTNDWHQLTGTFNNGSAIKWCYLASTDSTSLYRYAFIYAPGDIFAGFYLNVAEVGFFGWSEDDAADSGLVFAPTEISVSANTAVMAVSWNAGVNVDSYIVQRRTSAAEAWTDVVTLPSTARSYADGDRLKKGHYEFRVVAKGADGTEAWTAVTGCDFEPKRGLMLILR